MMSLVYFGCLYMWQGGTLYNYLKSILGETVDEDLTPTSRRIVESTEEVAVPRGRSVFLCVLAVVCERVRSFLEFSLGAPICFAVRAESP